MSKSTLCRLRARLDHNFVILPDQNNAHFRHFQQFLSRNGNKTADGEKKTCNDANIGILRTIWRTYDVLRDAFSMPLPDWRKII